MTIQWADNVRPATEADRKKFLECERCNVKRVRKVVPSRFAGQGDCPADEKVIEYVCPKCKDVKYGVILQAETLPDQPQQS